jgi:hypothetical protein
MKTECFMWCVEKAGWRIVKDDDGDPYCYYTQESGGFCHIDSVATDPVLYPLLLQRAIEGVNQGKGFIEISMAYDTFIVTDLSEGLFCDPIKKAFLIKGNYDQAKEAALERVWEREVEMLKYCEKGTPKC